MPVLLRWVLVAAATIVLIVAMALVAGASIPERIEVTRTIAINRPPESVWWVLTDYNNLALWHPQYRAARLMSVPGERPIRWSATYTDGRSANVVVSEDKYPLRYAEQISDSDLPFSGGWKLELERRDLTTLVTVHSNAELHRPLDRLFVHLFVKPELEVDRILDSLRRRVENTTAKPAAATS